MNTVEEDLIRRFAAGDDSLRQQAVSIFRAACKAESRKSDPDVRRTPAMRFMAEVDNPCPCYTLRAMYRAALVGGAPPGTPRTPAAPLPPPSAAAPASPAATVPGDGVPLASRQVEPEHARAGTCTAAANRVSVERGRGIDG